MDDVICYFKHNIRVLRRKYNLSQKEMAQIIGVSVGTLRRMERGDNNVRTHCGMVLRVCERFGISSDELLLDILS